MDDDKQEFCINYSDAKSITVCDASVSCVSANFRDIRCSYRHAKLNHSQNQKSTGHNSIITAPSIAKFTSESNIGDQAMSNCPWLNIDDQSIFNRGSMNFEILGSVTLVICL